MLSTQTTCDRNTSRIHLIPFFGRTKPIENIESIIVVAVPFFSLVFLTFSISFHGIVVISLTLCSYFSISLFHPSQTVAILFSLVLIRFAITYYYIGTNSFSRVSSVRSVGCAAEMWMSPNYGQRKQYALIMWSSIVFVGNRFRVLSSPKTCSHSFVLFFWSAHLTHVPHLSKS